MISLIFGILKNKKTKTTTIKKKPVLTDTENRSVVARGRRWVIGEIGKKGEGVKRCKLCYKISKSWGYNEQHGNYS